MLGKDSDREDGLSTGGNSEAVYIADTTYINHRAHNSTTSCMSEIKLHKIGLWLQLIRKMNKSMMNLHSSYSTSTEGLTSRNLAVLQQVQSIFVYRPSPRRFSFNELDRATGSFSRSTFHNHEGEYYGFVVKLFNSYWVALISNSRVISQGQCSLCFAFKADY